MVKINQQMLQTTTLNIFSMNILVVGDRHIFLVKNSSLRRQVFGVWRDPEPKDDASRHYQTPESINANRLSGVW